MNDKRLQRQKDLSELGLPDSVQITVDLTMGLAHYKFPNAAKEISHTIADLGYDKKRSINVDVGSDGRIWGFEDLGGPLAEVVNNWIYGLKRAKARLDLKDVDPKKYQERYGHKIHFAVRFEMDGKPDHGVGAACGEINSYTLASDETAWKQAIAKDRQCLRCQKVKP